MAYRVEAILSAVDRGFSSQFDKASRSVKKLQDSARNLGKVGDSLSSLGSKLTRTLTLPIAGGAVYAGKKFADFEQGLVGVGKTTGMAGKELKGFGDDISKMSSYIPASTNELLDLAQTAGQLGVHGRDDLLEFTQVMAEMGSATNLAGEEGAVAMARFANVMGLDVGDSIRDVGDAVVRLGNNFATSESDIMSMSSELAAGARLVGITTPEVLALGTAMSSLGIRSEEGGSAMTMVLNKIDKAVSQGGTKLEEFANVAGMSAEQFASVRKSSPIDAVQALMAGLDEVSLSGGNMNQVLTDLGITGIRESKVVKSLAQNHKVLEAAVKMSNEAYLYGNDLSKEAAAASETLHAGLRMLGSTLSNIAKDVFATFAPAITDMVFKLRDFAAGWFNLSDSTKQSIATMVAKIGLFVASLGPLSSMGGKVAKALGVTVKGFSKAKVAMSGITSQISGTINKFARNLELALAISGNKLSAFVPLVTKSVSLANMGLSALFPAAVIGVALIGLGALYTGFSDEIDKLLDTAKTKGPEIVTNLANGITSKIDYFISQGAQLVAGLASAIAVNLGTIFNAGTNIIISLVQGVGDNIGTLISSAVQVVGSFLQGLLYNLPKLAVAGIQFIAQLIVGIVQNLPSIITAAGQAIVGFVQGIIENIPTLVQVGFMFIVKLVEGIGHNLPAIVEAGREIIKNLASAILDALVGVVGTIVDAVKGFFKKIFAPGKEEATKSKEDITTELEGLKGNIDTETTQMADIFQTNGALASSNFNLQMGQMSTGVNDKLLTMSQNMGMTMDELIATVNEKGYVMRNGMVITAADINTQVSTETSAMADNMAENAQRGVDAANLSFDGLANKLPTDASTTNESTSSQYEDLADRITNSTDRANQAVEAGMTTVNANFTMRLGALPAKTDDILNRVSNGFINAFNAIGKGTTDRANTIVNNFTQGMAKLNSASTNGLNRLASGFESAFARVVASVNQGTNMVANAVNQMANRVNSTFSSFSSRLVSTNQSMWNKVSSNTKSQLNRMYSSFNSSLNKMNSKFKSFSSGLKNLNSSMRSNVVSRTKSSGNAMASAFSQACSKVKSLANSLRSSIITTMNSAVGGMRNAGYNAGMGFYNGLASTQGSIMSLANSIAWSVSNRIQSALRIHSPSRVLMKLGSFAGRGLAVGLEKSRSYVNRAVDGLSSTVESVRTGMSSSNDFYGTESLVIPLTVNVKMGSNEFRAVSRDISREQGKDLRLERTFGI